MTGAHGAVVFLLELGEGFEEKTQQTRALCWSSGGYCQCLNGSILMTAQLCCSFCVYFLKPSLFTVCLSFKTVTELHRTHLSSYMSNPYEMWIVKIKSATKFQYSNPSPFPFLK